MSGPGRYQPHPPRASGAAALAGSHPPGHGRSVPAGDAPPPAARLARELLLAVVGLAVAEVTFAVLVGAGVVPNGSMTAGALRTMAAAAVYALLARALPEAVPAAGEPPARARRAAAAAALAGVAALAGSYGLGLVLEAAGLAPREQAAVLELVERLRATGGPLDHLAFVTATCVLAPVAEEWLFRGLLFRRLRAAGGLPWAYALSSLLFAAIHQNPSGFVIYTWLGLCFAWPVAHTGRFAPAVAAHATNNAVVVALLYAGVALTAQ